MPTTLAKVASQLNAIAAEVAALEVDEKRDDARDASLANRVSQLERLRGVDIADSDKLADRIEESRGDIANLSLSQSGLAVQLSSIREQFVNITSRLANLELDFQKMRDAANSALAAAHAVDDRLRELEAVVRPPVDPPTPPIDPPLPVEPPVPIVVTDAPLVVSDENAIISLAGKTIAGIRLEPYRVRSISINGPGKIIARPGTHAIDLSKMADGGTATINGVDEIAASGVDVFCVHAPAIALLRIRECVSRCVQENTANRDLRPANLWCPGTQVDIDGCAILGGNSSIYSPHNSSRIRQSLLSPSQFAVDGYAITGGEIEDVLILPMLSGRGVLVEGAGQRCKLTNSIILAWDRGSLYDTKGGETRWYDRTKLDGPGVRVRYRASIEMRGCHILSVGGDKWNNATGGMFSHCEDKEPSQIEDNVFHAIMAMSVPGNWYARAVSFESQQARKAIRFARNELGSNQYILSSTGSDNEDGSDFEIIDPQFRWIDGLMAINRLEAAIKSHSHWLRALNSDASINPAFSRAVRERVEAVMAGLTSAIRYAPSLDSRKSWLAGVYDGNANNGERCTMAGVRGTEGVINPVTWMPSDVTYSQRPGVREMLIDGKRLGNSPDNPSVMTLS